MGERKGGYHSTQIQDRTEKDNSDPPTPSSAFSSASGASPRGLHFRPSRSPCPSLCPYCYCLPLCARPTSSHLSSLSSSVPSTGKASPWVQPCHYGRHSVALVLLAGFHLGMTWCVPVPTQVVSSTRAGNPVTVLFTSTSLAPSKAPGM